MSGPIGYYVHHHGRGHLDRATLLAGKMEREVILLGTGLSANGADGVELADDRLAAGFDGFDGEVARPLSLHYAPLRHSGIRLRTATISRWFEKADPSLMVVDVSTEVAMLARLASVPVAYVRLAGLRVDQPHLEAFRSALTLIAPFHESLEHPDTPEWVRKKTFYAPGLCRRPKISERNVRRIVVVLGRGASRPTARRFRDMALALPSHEIEVLGEVEGEVDLPDNLKLRGWVDDVAETLGRAGVIVGGAGDGVTNLALACGAPFVCLPEARPFDEQAAKGRALQEQGAALTLGAWPDANSWPTIINAALRLVPDASHKLDAPDGVARCAQHLSECAETSLARIYA